MPDLKKLTAEAVGTFILCFLGAGSICLATLKGAGYEGLLGVAIAHGIALSVAVSATMNISGGHVNPAVTVAMLATRRINLPNAIAYILAQLVGATIAGMLVLAIFKGMMTADGKSAVAVCNLGTPTYGDPVTTVKAIVIEACLTFLLLTAVFYTAVDPRAPKIGGFGIGLTIAADILVGGPLTGASMNPARTFGPGIVAFVSGNFSNFWAQQQVYWIGPIIGAVFAAVLYEGFIAEKKKR
ncbi:MAG TPA: aquaporin [Phycisphaerae bacterium]|nr:aquaporin [Phycisphaerae bacterium]